TWLSCRRSRDEPETGIARGGIDESLSRRLPVRTPDGRARVRCRRRRRVQRKPADRESHVRGGYAERCAPGDRVQQPRFGSRTELRERANGRGDAELLG